MNKSINYQIVISGVGGQGVLFITRILAQACMAEGRSVLTSETHGMAQRGGTVISHLKIGDHAGPLIRPGHADLLVALKPEGLDQYFKYLKKEGLCLVNQSRDTGAGQSSRVRTLDADALSLEDNQPGAVNLYMIGAALSLINAAPLDALIAQVEDRLKNKNESVKSRAIHSVKRGYEAFV